MYDPLIRPVLNIKTCPREVKQGEGRPTNAIDQLTSTLHDIYIIRTKFTGFIIHTTILLPCQHQGYQCHIQDNMKKYPTDN